VDTQPLFAVAGPTSRFGHCPVGPFSTAAPRLSRSEKPYTVAYNGPRLAIRACLQTEPKPSDRDERRPRRERGEGGGGKRNPCSVAGLAPSRRLHRARRRGSSRVRAAYGAAGAGACRRPRDLAAAPPAGVAAVPSEFARSPPLPAAEASNRAASPLDSRVLAVASCSRRPRNKAWPSRFGGLGLGFAELWRNFAAKAAHCGCEEARHRASNDG
jgi:hypothetical protein